MENIVFTFIIPHKNCPELLQRCVDSIPQRDDIQIVVIDDNSEVDKKPSIERQGVEIILIDAEHSKGAGRARNIGLEHAKGEWLLFADADDYFSENLMALLDKYQEDNTTDLVYLSASKFDEDGVLSGLIEGQLVDDYLHSKKNAEMHLRYGIWTPWSRMVKNAMVTKYKIRFDEIPAANDKMFGLLSSKYAKTIAAEGAVVYYYFRPSFNSQTDKKRNPLMFNELLDLRCRTIKIYNEVGYHPIPSVLGMFRMLENKNWFRAYKKTLKANGISAFTDMYRYICERFNKA